MEALTKEQEQALKIALFRTFETLDIQPEQRAKIGNCFMFNLIEQGLVNISDILALMSNTPPGAAADITINAASGEVVTAYIPEEYLDEDAE